MENLAQTQQEPENNPLRSVPKKNTIARFAPILVVVLVVILGAVTGLVVSSRLKSEQITHQVIDEENLTPEKKEELQVVTRDQAEGTLEKNDKFEETAQGQWKLIRSGGESQTAYLTSSFIDLDPYIGKKVRVFGETLGSSKVGWLLDVAKVEVQ